MASVHLLVLFCGAASAMRPNVAESMRGVTHAALGGIAAKMRKGSAADNLIALHDAVQISGELVARYGNATDHLSDDDIDLIKEVVEVIRVSMYASMTSSHVEE